MCEIGGDLQSQRDVHYELKVPSALTKTRQAGQGSAAHGGCCASLGHKFGFGGTLDQTLLKVLGCKERGHKSQGPLVHATGKGWVKEHKGQYYDALHVKNGIVKICLVESQGGIAPPTKRSNQENHPQLRQRGRQPERRRPHRLRHSLRQRPGLCPAPLATALARRRLWRRAKHQQRCSQHACRALIHDRSQCPPPLRAGLLGPRVVSPHPQGLQGSHLNLSQTSAQRHRSIFFSITPNAAKGYPPREPREGCEQGKEAL